MSRVTDKLRWMRPVRETDLPALELAAQQDGHSLVLPSHVFERGGEIVGCISVGKAVLVMPWFDSKKCAAADTIYFINQTENLAASLMPAGSNGLLCVPFVPGSPLHPYIERLGYQNAGDVSLTFKKVT